MSAVTSSDAMVEVVRSMTPEPWRFMKWNTLDDDGVEFLFQHGGEPVVWVVSISGKALAAALLDEDALRMAIEAGMDSMAEAHAEEQGAA
jgi:hypothetical protein